MPNNRHICYSKEKIKERHESIDYWIENILLMTIQNRSYWRRLFSFIEEKLNKNSINQYNQQVVGINNGPQIENRLIKNCPFELLYNLNSTIGLIITWFEWNQIASCPTILRQKYLEDIFSFQVNRFSEFYNEVWDKNIAWKLSNVEFKLHLIGYLKAKIIKEIKELLPKLMLR